MSEIEISASDRAKLLSFSEDELMANIALHDASAAAQFGIAGVANGVFATKAEMMGEMHAAGLWGDVVAKGKAIFRKLWNEAKKSRMRHIRPTCEERGSREGFSLYSPDCLSLNWGGPIRWHC